MNLCVSNLNQILLRFWADVFSPTRTLPLNILAVLSAYLNACRVSDINATSARDGNYHVHTLFSNPVYNDS
jgi:hypothetical protein